MIVILLGYMGSGKSTIGSLLAKKLNYGFVDLDNYIETELNESISNLFKKKGEICYRIIESKTVKKICKVHSNIVLSLGGGTPCYDNTMSLLLQNPNVFTVYLKATSQTLYKRLNNKKIKRPLISKIKDKILQEFIAKHLFERSVFYSQAHHIECVESKSNSQIVEAISIALKKNDF